MRMGSGRAALGGHWFNDDLTECIINSAEAYDGWYFLDALYHEYEIAMPGSFPARNRAWEAISATARLP